jgi:23S rRNA pseudoU1915 N3-methylase RlmH
MITILAISDGYKHFGEAIKEYEKRLQKSCKIILIKPISHTNKEYIKVKETLLVKEKLEKTKGKIILLDERGKSFSTLAFSELLEDYRRESEDIIFVI